MDVPAQIRLGFQNQGLPLPSLTWIKSALPNRNPLPPLPALTATVRARFLAADLQTSGLFDSPPPAFPPNLSNVREKEVRLARDVPVQVLDIENLSKSKWEQVEELEAIARGEQTRGREVIRLPTASEEGEDAVDGQPVPSNGTAFERSGRGGPTAPANSTNASSKTSTHRLILQDCKGQKIYGLELVRMSKIDIGTLNIGEKILLKRGTIVARGTILLEPTNCVILGGKVESWHKAWVENRLMRLREAVGADRN